MPSKGAYEVETLPEVNGCVYDEAEMALFHAKLSYHSTIEARLATNNAHLTSIAENQARIIKRWELLRQMEKEKVEKGECLSPGDKKQMAQYEWRYKNLEELATKSAWVGSRLWMHG